MDSSTRQEVGQESDVSNPNCEFKQVIRISTMKNIVRLLLAISISVVAPLLLHGQTIPKDSLYLGQTPPGDTPKIFTLSVSPKFFAAERITISNDGKEIYYSELKGYYPINTPRIKNYGYAGSKWTGPFNLFDGYCAPALSITSDTMYFENDTSQTFFSTKKGLNWSNPKRILSKLDAAHYLQVTDKGNYYVSSRPKNTIGVSDWCKLEFSGSDTTAIGLGIPLNTAWDNLDFFVSKDETFMIVATPFGLSVSYPKKDGNWTNPRGLGSKINFGLGMWGPFVTPDNKYLFYTTGTKQDYSDVNVYWVRVDGLIDSLKHTNIPPYVKYKIKSQNGSVSNSYSFTIPDDTFFDEDGDASFTYSATLTDGSPLPSLQKLFQVHQQKQANSKSLLQLLIREMIQV
jgi:hypothetical protein